MKRKSDRNVPRGTEFVRAACALLVRKPAAKRRKVAKLPLVLTLAEMAALYRVSPQTLRQFAAGTFPLPLPDRPYRWKRPDARQLARLRRRK